VAGSDTFVEIGHLDPAQVVLRDLVARGVDVDTEDPRGIEPEDLLLAMTSSLCASSMAAPSCA